MGIKIISAELGIGACSMADIPAAVMEGYPREELNNKKLNTTTEQIASIKFQSNIVDVMNRASE